MVAQALLGNKTKNILWDFFFFGFTLLGDFSDFGIFLGIFKVSQNSNRWKSKKNKIVEVKMRSPKEVK